eukprot:m.94801 g.94801  ORF g.94801 m.94801 type:complete len:130 (+) comp18398_c0_seq5:41-430(+)
MLRNLCVLVWAMGVAAGTAASSFCEESGWTTVFDDEFHTFDESKWTKTLGMNSGQGRDALLTDDNVYVENGNLVLRSQRNATHGFTSGAVTTQDKAFFTFGRCCVRAKLPGNSFSPRSSFHPTKRANRN